MIQSTTRPAPADPVSSLPALIVGRPPSADAVWLGAVHVGSDFTPQVNLEGAEGFGRAGVLVRSDSSVLAYAEWPIDAARSDGSRLREVIDTATRLQPSRPMRRTPSSGTRRRVESVSVVICTRDRPASLRQTLRSVLASDYPDFEVVVVDNAATTLDTSRYIDGLDDERVSVAHAFVPGISVARNAGIRIAKGSIIAFVDDDVLVDESWLWRLVRNFDNPQTGCVTGLVPTRVASTALTADPTSSESWIQPLSARTFRMDTPPRDPLFPFRVSDFGCGANFATRRAVAFALGGFDERLGVGSPGGAGEDIDWYLRILVHGYSLVFDPDAVVCHQRQQSHEEAAADAHRRDIGLGAWVFKTAIDRRLAPVALKRAPAGVRRMSQLLGEGNRQGMSPIGKRGQGVFIGASRLIRGQLEGRVGRPLERFARPTTVPR